MRERTQVNGTATPDARETSAAVPGRTTRIAELAPSPAQPTPRMTGAVRSPDVAPRPTVGVEKLFGTPFPGGVVSSQIVSPDHAATTQTVTATIPRPPGAERAQPAQNAPSARGAEPGKETSAGDLTIEPIVSNLDAIAPTLTFSGSMSQGGTVEAGEFGATNSTPSLKDIEITQASGSFTVTATFSLATTWDTRKTTGPDGQIDLPDENAAALTSTNYPTAVSDLTPNMGNLGGRPPRTKFWAKDLTERHEKVHAGDHQHAGKQGMTETIQWLKTQTALTEAEVLTLLTTALDQIVAYMVAHGAKDDRGETHAYSDGAASYKARADKIKAKGDKKGYP